MERIMNWLFKVNKWFINLGLISLFAIMVIDTVGIVGAKYGVRIIPGGKTIIEELMTVVVFVGIAYLLFERGHIKTDFVKKHFPPGLRFFSDILAYVVMIGVSGLIFWTNGKTAIEYLELNVTSPADIPVPMGPFFLLISISFLSLGVCSFFLLIKKCLSGVFRKTNNEEDIS